MTTVCCVWVQGQVDYRVEYVTKLRSMVARHLSEHHHFVCFTDRRHLLPSDMATIPVTLPQGLFGWWAKLEVFNAAHGLVGRVLYLDLDSLVVGDLQPVMNFPASFALAPPGGNFRPATHLTVHRYNSSVMVWDAPSQAALYDRWEPRIASELWGDQDWIGQESTATIMPAAWVPRFSDLHGQPPGPDAKIVLCKKPKNEQAAERCPWVREAWR